MWVVLAFIGTIRWKMRFAATNSKFVWRKKELLQIQETVLQVFQQGLVRYKTSQFRWIVFFLASAASYKTTVTASLKARPTCSHHCCEKLKQVKLVSGPCLAKNWESLINKLTLPLSQSWNLYRHLLNIRLGKRSLKFTTEWLCIVKQRYAKKQ